MTRIRLILRTALRAFSSSLLVFDGSFTVGFGGANGATVYRAIAAV